MSDESLFREVDEEVRQEQFKKLWGRYGNLIIGLCLAVILGVAGFQGWKFWQARQSETAAEAFFTAADLAAQGKTDEALKQFETVTHSGYATLAKMREANALGAAGKAADAVKIYDAIAADGSADPAIRDLARIRAALVLSDTATPADLEARVKQFDAAGNPWRHAARLVMAGALWRTKDYTAADTHVKAMLEDPETPPGTRQNAQILADLLAPQLAAK